MKMRNKGKVHPFTSSSSSPSSSSPCNRNKGSLSVLKLLPAAILTPVSVLSLEDREVLAYMIARSLKSTNPSFLPADFKKNRPKTCPAHHSPALFDCDCFNCYTSFWFRWDSSPNRDLIHQAIEAFEDHLNNGEQFSNRGNSKNKRKEKMGRRKDGKLSADGGLLPQIPAAGPPENEGNLAAVPPENDLAAAEADIVEEEVKDDASPPSAVVHNHSRGGLARKVLPDVMGIFNSRLWSLWSPNV